MATQTGCRFSSTFAANCWSTRRKLGIPVRYTRNLYEDVSTRISGNEIRLALGSDVVVTGAAEADGFQQQTAADGTWLNEYGMRMRQGPVTWK